MNPRSADELAGPWKRASQVEDTAWEQETADQEESLQEKFSETVQKIETSLANFHQKQIDLQKENLVKLEELIPRIEALVDNTDLVSAEKELRKLQAEWKDLDRFDKWSDENREKYNVLQGNYQNSCDRFKEAQEWLRWSNLRAKQDICSRLEEARDSDISSDELYKQLRQLQGEWKTVGPVSWENSKEVWDQYRKIIDDIYEKCQDYFSELEEERKK